MLVIQNYGTCVLEFRSTEEGFALLPVNGRERDLGEFLAHLTTVSHLNWLPRMRFSNRPRIRAHLLRPTDRPFRRVVDPQAVNMVLAPAPA